MGSPPCEVHSPKTEVSTVQKKHSEFLQMEGFPEQMGIQEWCEEGGLANFHCEFFPSRRQWCEKRYKANKGEGRRLRKH